MTRKDYQVIAEVVSDFIKTSVDNNNTLSKGHAENLIDSFVYKLRAIYPNFHEEKFMDACKK